MSKKDKQTPRDYADDLRVAAAAKQAADAVMKDEGVDDEVNLESLGLQMFDASASGDIVQWTPEHRQALVADGYTMVERYITIPPGGGVNAYWLGWSGMLLPDPQEKDRLRYLRKMHLELKSGARVSHIEAAQLGDLFALPCDGSVGVTIYRGGTGESKSGRRFGHWEVWTSPGARPGQHEEGKSYAQIAGQLRLHAQLQQMTYAELRGIRNAPPELLAPYLAAAQERELEARAAERARQA